MRTMLITIGRPNIARNIFTEVFLKEISAKSHLMRIIIAVPRGSEKEYQSIFQSLDAIIVGIKPSFKGFLVRVISALMRNGVNSKTNLWSKMRSFLRGDTGFITTYIKRAYTFVLGDVSSWKRFLRSCLLRWGHPNSEVAQFFNREKPDVVFITGLTEFDFDVPIACEAKRRNIRLIGMTRSWDNFTSHGLTRVLPDRLILQNTFLKEMAQRYQAIDLDKLPFEIIGTPHYDEYFDYKGRIRSREEFFAELGIDPSKRLVLYAAMGDFLFQEENDLAEIFEGLVNSRRLPENVHFIYRPHPKFQTRVHRIRDMKHVTLDEQTAESSTNLKDELSRWDLDRLMHLLIYSDVIVNTASTMALEGALFDKPVLCVGFNGKRNDAPYWLSVNRFFDSYTHFEDLIKTGGIPIFRDSESLAVGIINALKSPEQGHAGRMALIDRFIHPHDGRSSQRLADILLKEIDVLVGK